MSNLQKDFQITGLAEKLRAYLPNGYFGGIVLSYLANASLMVLFLHPTMTIVCNNNTVLATIILALGAGVVQYFRFLLIFTNQLLPNGVQSSRLLIQGVAFGMMLFACTEIYHAVHAIAELQSSQSWTLTLLGWGVAFGGYMLEIQFIRKLDEFTDLEVYAGYIDDEELKDRIRAAQRQATPTATSQAEEVLNFEDVDLTPYLNGNLGNGRGGN